jgi:hypothetical protein
MFRLGYSLPASLLDKINMDRVRLAVNIENAGSSDRAGFMVILNLKGRCQEHIHLVWISLSKQVIDCLRI